MNISIEKLGRASTLATILFAFISIVATIAAILSSNTLDSPPYAPIELTDRIDAVSNSLIDVSAELSIIQWELEQRIEIVEELRGEAEQAEAMIDLTSEQVAAIRNMLNAELERNEARNFWATFFTSFFFLILGSAVTFLAPRVIDKLKNSKDHKDKLQDKED